MKNRLPQETSPTITTLDDLAKLANYSLIDTLNCDPDAKENGVDSRAATSLYRPLCPRQSHANQRPRVRRSQQKLFSRTWLRRQTWHSWPTSSGCSPATSRTFRSRCARSVGRVGTHFRSSAPSTISSAHSKLAMDTATVAQFPCLRPSSTVGAGKCS